MIWEQLYLILLMLSILHLPDFQIPFYRVFMAALHSRCRHNILPCGFFLSSFFIPRLISAATDWMSTILLHMVWP